MLNPFKLSAFILLLFYYPGDFNAFYFSPFFYS